MADVIYNLQQENDGYIDQDGVYYDEPEEWLWYGILGGCGCGSANSFSLDAFKLLTLFATPHEQRGWSIWDDRFYELLAHWLDSCELIEHGTNIAGSWLTDKGKQVYEAINRIKEASDAR